MAEGLPARGSPSARARWRAFRAAHRRGISLGTNKSCTTVVRSSLGSRPSGKTRRFSAGSWASGRRSTSSISSGALPAHQVAQEPGEDGLAGGDVIECGPGVSTRANLSSAPAGDTRRPTCRRSPARLRSCRSRPIGSADDEGPRRDQRPNVRQVPKVGVLRNMHCSGRPRCGRRGGGHRACPAHGATIFTRSSAAPSQ